MLPADHASCPVLNSVYLSLADTAGQGLGPNFSVAVSFQPNLSGHLNRTTSFSPGGLQLSEPRAADCAKLGNRWSAVAKKITGRTGQQCAQRWRHKVNPHIKKEKWTDDEDDRLAMLVRQYGSAWAEIARRMRGRTDQQCMGRWRRHLDPSIRREAWSANEDALLVRMYQEFGSQWSRISKAVAGRTAQQCRARWFQLQPNGGPDGRMMPSGRSSARRPARRAHNDEFDEDDDDDDLGEEFDDDEDFGDEEGEGSGAGDEEARASRLDSIAEGDGYDDRGRSHHILPLASPRGPNRMYAPRDKVNGFARAPPPGRRPVPMGIIGRIPGTGYRPEPKLEGEPATPMPKPLSPMQSLPQRSQNGRQKGHNTSARPGGMQGQQHNRMSDSWVSSNTVLRKSGHPHGGHFAASTAFPNWIGGNPDGDDTSAPPTPAGRTLGQRGGNPPDELSPPAMLGSPLSRQTGRRAEAQLLNGHTSPLPWNAHTTPAGERLFASPSPRKRPAPGALPLGTSPLRNASRPTSTFPNLPITEASKPRIGPHNGFNTPGNICLGPAATMATPPKDSSAQPPRVPDGQSSPQASQSPLPNGFNSPAEASAAPQDGSSQDTDAFECTLPQNPGTVTSSAGGSDRISPIFGGPHPSPGQYWRSSPTNSVLSLLRSPTGGPAYKADLLASPDFSALVHSPTSAEKLVAAHAAGIPLPKALATLASQQGRPGLAPGVQMLLNGHVQDDGDENNAGPAARCSRKVVRKLINAAPGHIVAAALAAQQGPKGDGHPSADGISESPTKKSRSEMLSVQPLQTHQPSRLQGSSTTVRPRSEQARQRFLAMMDTI
ncbi:hypothetical protein WJX84_001208 [Apatococcus fuscideae]|uniref:Uncharacterized protein n=1 Tax=Apatococcus fuscideae TaxID=2026836 RepID=A0AAW1TE68_9CHLO